MWRERFCKNFGLLAMVFWIVAGSITATNGSSWELETTSKASHCAGSLSALDSIHQQLDSPTHQKIESPETIVALLESRTPKAIEQIANSYSHMIVSIASRWGISSYHQDFADLYQELYMTLLELIEKFDSTKLSDTRQSADEKLAAYIRFGLHLKMKRYWSGRGYETIAQIRPHHNVILATDLVAQAEPQQEPSSKMNAVLIMDRFGDELRSEHKARLEIFELSSHLRDFISQLKVDYAPLNSSDYRIRQGIIALRWLSGSKDLMKLVGLQYAVPKRPNLKTGNLGWTSVEWSTRSVSEVLHTHPSNVSFIELSLRKSFLKFIKSRLTRSALIDNLP